MVICAPVFNMAPNDMTHRMCASCDLLLRLFLHLLLFQVIC